MIIVIIVGIIVIIGIIIAVVFSRKSGDSGNNPTPTPKPIIP